MAKPIGPICNLNCSYCFYLEKEKLYPHVNNWVMSDNVLESYIKQYIETQEIDIVTFAWQGGEPTLLGIDFFKKAIELQKKYCSGKRIENTFQTNGILLNDAWGELFFENDFLIGLSIDGPKELHDKYRVFKGGQPSFEKVMRGLQYLQKHSVEFNTLTCVQKENSEKPLDVYKFLKEAGSRFMQFIPIVERAAVNQLDEELNPVSPEFEKGAIVSDWSVEPLQYGKFLTAIFDEWVKYDVGKYFVQIFDVSLEQWYEGSSSLCLFRETCGEALAIEHNGDIYSCDHYVYPKYMLGNILKKPLFEIVNAAKQYQFGESKKESLPDYCVQCKVRFACNGGCPKHRFSQTPDGNRGLNYLCKGYKYFFQHIDVYMKFMSEELKHERAPANVMNWILNKGNTAAHQNKISRNELCYCGSGKKYKNCCG